MIIAPELPLFTLFLSQHKTIATNFILAIVFLLFLPAQNYYYSLDLSTYHPLVRHLDLDLSNFSFYPQNVNQVSAPLISAYSAVVIDVNSKAILFTKNPDEKLLPASTTKIMTALVALDQYRLNQIVTIDSHSLVEGQNMGLESGEKITVENLLFGLLVQSGNDAAQALADFYPQGETGFVAAMNQKVKDFNLLNTQFQNPTGLDEFGHYTTVHDLSLIAAHAMENPDFVRFVGTQKITVTDIDHTIVHELETINELLGEIPGLKGVKTGWTELAGECLVTYTQRDNHAIITAVLNSQDRFTDSRLLIDWVFTNYQWTDPPAIHL